MIRERPVHYAQNMIPGHPVWCKQYRSKGYSGPRVAMLLSAVTCKRCRCAVRRVAEVRKMLHEGE